MPVGFRMTMKPTFRDLQGRFAKAEKRLFAIRQEELRIQARRALELFQDEAPERSGTFKSKLRWKSFTDGDTIGFTITMPEPLATFIIEGTKPHTIGARKASVLAFPWPNGPYGVAGMGNSGLHFYPSVHHPGTKPNRFPGRAYRRWLPGARKFLKRVSTRWAAEVKGSGS